MKCLILFFCFFIFLFSFVNAELYYEIGLNYSSNSLAIQKVDLIYSRFPESNFYSNSENFTNYNIYLIDFNGNPIYSEEISIPNLMIVDNGTLDGGITSGENIWLNNFSFNLYFPFSKEISQIEIRNSKSNLVLKNNLDSFETNLSSNSNLLVADKNSNKSPLIYYLVLIILFLILLSVAVYFLIKKYFS